jgi:hypothetical protein
MLRLTLPSAAPPSLFSHPCSPPYNRNGTEEQLQEHPNCNTSCAIVTHMAKDQLSYAAETACILSFLLVPSCPCLAACAAHYSLHGFYFHSRPLLNRLVTSAALALAAPPCGASVPALLSPFAALALFANRSGQSLI